MKVVVGEYKRRGETLEQPKLPHHTLWQMELDSPMANQRATHEPEILLRRASRVQVIVLGIAESIPAPIRLPLHLHMSQKIFNVLLS